MLTITVEGKARKAIFELSQDRLKRTKLIVDEERASDSQSYDYLTVIITSEDDAMPLVTKWVYMNNTRQEIMDVSENVAPISLLCYDAIMAHYADASDTKRKKIVYRVSTISPVVATSRAYKTFERVWPIMLRSCLETDDEIELIEIE